MGLEITLSTIEDKRVSAEAARYLVNDIELKFEPLKNASADELLGVLMKEYIRNGSGLATYLSLVYLAGDMEGDIFSLSKNLSFGNAQALNVLKGEHAMRDDINKARIIDGFDSRGMLLHFYQADHLESGPAKDRLIERFCLKEGLLKNDEHSLLMEIDRNERQRVILLSTGFIGRYRTIHFSHKMSFKNYYQKEEGLVRIGGPWIHFKENEERLLFETSEEMEHWLKALDILREPKCQKI